MDILIYVTVGTAEFQFNRLFRVLDELCDEGILNGDNILAQVGKSDYKPRNYKSFDLLDNDTYKEIVQKANVIITHSGTGSIISGLRYKKKIIVFPRIKEFGEHVDNHQVELCNVFSISGYILPAHNKEELIQCFNKLDNFEPFEFISNSKQFNQLVIKLIDEI